MWQSTRRCARLFTAIIYFAVLSGAASADTWTAPASEFANNIAAKTGPGSVFISFANRCSLAASDASSITAQIQSQLQARGMRFVQPEAVTSIAVTLSENTQGYLWIAEIKRGPSTDILMTSVPRALSPTSVASNLVTLRRRLILTSEDPILDVAIDAESTVVLSPEKLTRYRPQDGQLHEILSLPVKHSRPFPSDVRGRITSVRGGSLDVSLPGVHCVQANPQQATLECTDTDDPWAMSSTGTPVAISAFFSPVRNFFTGAVTVRNALPNAQPADRSYDLPPFYSLAQVEEGGLPLWVLSAVDGQVRFLGGTRSQSPTETTLRGWGSDIAAITTTCNHQQFVLATRDSDFTQRDTIQSFQIVNRKSIPAAAPEDFAGPITALWTSAISSDSVTAVSHNLNTGKYEAYSLSLVCNQ